MKQRVCIIAILVVGFSGAILALNHSGHSEVQTFRPDKTKKNIRLVLVSISKGSVFRQEQSTDKNRTAYQVIPRTTLECLVEYLGDGEITSSSMFFKPAFTKDGMPASTDFIMKDVYRGHGSLKTMPYHLFNLPPLHKPEVHDPDKANFTRIQMFGSRQKNTPVDFQITVGINNETEIFDFKNVPVF
jgi:hypothetical protein